jgi:hypothetical protein
MRREYIKTLERQTTPPYDHPLVAEEWSGRRYKVSVDGVDRFISWDALMEMKNARNPDPRMPDLIIVDFDDETGTT